MRYIAIDQDFRSGEVLVQVSDSEYAGRALNPLEYLDIAIYANWLSAAGDFILHAAGVDHQGLGICYVGPSGAGKSTLASAWAARAPGKVLGEDQVILRFIDGRFWIYGTPWHQNPELCSPCGVPLAKVFFLERDGAPGIQPCDAGAAAIRLLENAFVPLYHAAGMSKILNNLSQLVDQVPLARLGLHSRDQVQDHVLQLQPAGAGTPGPGQVGGA